MRLAQGNVTASAGRTSIKIHHEYQCLLLGQRMQINSTLITPYGLTKTPLFLIGEQDVVSNSESSIPVALVPTWKPVIPEL